MADKRVILIDGSAIIYRAFYAIPSSFRTSEGVPTNATYGFALMFRKLLAGKAPAFAAMVFDAPGKTFRDDKYPDYKAQRPSMPSDLRQQLAYIDRVVETHRYPVLRVPGFEADDVIGTLARRAESEGYEVHIISGDKDFAQLINDKVRMIDTMRDITYDEELVRKKWGVKPSQFVDYLALVGDSVDNIPGVPGIGAKGAKTLLEKYGDLEGIYANIDDFKGKRRENLADNRDVALMSQYLATIVTDVPLDVTWNDLKLVAPNTDDVNALYKELEFFSLLDSESQSLDEVNDEQTRICGSVADIIGALARIGTKTCAIHAIHDAAGPVWGHLVGMALALATGEAWYVPILGGDGGLGEPAVAAMEEWLADAEQPKVTHDLRETICVLSRAGLTIHGVVGDTQLGSFLIDPTGLIPHATPQIARHYLQRTLQPLKVVVGSGKSQIETSDAPVAELGAWLAHVTVAVAESWPIIEERLAAADRTMLLHELSMPTARVLAGMQLDGVRVDDSVLERLSEEFTARRAEVEAEVHRAAGHEFNIGSTKQLSAVLFEELELPVIKRTKTGYSTAAAVLEELAPKHEIAQLVLDWRSLDKLINTYTAVLRAAIVPRTGRIHPTFNQTSGASGRLITSDPDIQRTPIRTGDGKRIREAFIPREGWKMVSADWSQIELRVLAHFSEDEGLRSAFRDGVDLHRQTASQLFDVDPDEVTPTQRNMGKTVNFATIYGQGATALGKQLGISRTEAKRLITRYFEVYSGVRTWLDDTISDAKATGYVDTILGRRRLIPELSSNNFADRAYGERIAGNTPIQGSAADICKLAMLKIDAAFRERGFEARMLMQIHDELVFEVPPSEVDAVCEVVRACMENPLPLSVPLRVDMGVGDSWASAH